MTHLALTIDPDPIRRGRFLAAARTRLSTLTGLVCHQAECCDLGAIWGAFPGAPQSHRTTESSFALILGDAIKDDGQRLCHPIIGQDGAFEGSALPNCDGYYLALSYLHQRGLVLGVDLLGMFPLYYFAGPETFVAATSCELCLAHPHIQGDLNPAGLTGILLTNGLVANQPLITDLTRLAAGSQLRWSPGKGGREFETYRPAIHTRYRSLSLDETWRLLDERVSDAVRRHSRAEIRSSLLLSGGLDSRMLAGYLAHDQITDTALVLGRDTDQEVRAAAEVARALGLRLHRERHEPTDAEFLASARRCAEWEHLAGGFSSFELESAAALVGQLGPACWGGYVGDLTLGGSAIGFSRDPHTGANTFARFLAGTNAWGVPRNRLVRLLGKRGEDLVESQVELLRRQWDDGDEPPPQRSLRLRLHMRVRYHIGVVMQRLSMRSWPIVPFVDRGVLDIVFNAPEEHLQRRQLQYAIIKARFPELAEIAQDTNSFLFEPAWKTAQRKASVLRRLFVSLRRSGRKLYWRTWRRIEPRRYYRLFDPDEPCWRVVRAAAESQRENLCEWFDARELDALWPAPQVTMGLQSPFSQGGALRLILGLGLWVESRKRAMPVRPNRLEDQLPPL